MKGIFKLFIFLPILLIYYPIFSGFFFMDDFYFLKISQANNFSEFINLFKPIRYIPYRPVSQQLFFFSFQKIFGLNPLPFHIFIFSIHLINSWLVYQISSVLLKDKSKSKLISLIYAATSLHFVGLFSITGSYFLFGVFYFLLSLLFWLKFKKEKKTKFYLFSLTVFILGIFASEIVMAIFPFILILYFSKRNLLRLLPYLLVGTVNLFINLVWAGPPTSSTFQLQPASFLTTFKWYFLRALGLPEGVKNGNLEEKVIIYLLFSLLVGIVFISLYLNKDILKKKLMILIKYSFLVIILAFPFYLLPNHLNPIYFSLAFVVFLLILGTIFPKRILLIYTVLYIILSFFSVRLLSHTHWTVRRSRLAKYWLEQSEKKELNRKENTITLYLPNNTEKEELKITLQRDTAFSLIYHNKNLKTNYEIK